MGCVRKPSYRGVSSRTPAGATMRRVVPVLAAFLVLGSATWAATQRSSRPEGGRKAALIDGSPKKPAYADSLHAPGGESVRAPSDTHLVASRGASSADSAVSQGVWWKHVGFGSPVQVLLLVVGLAGFVFGLATFVRGGPRHKAREALEALGYVVVRQPRIVWWWRWRHSDRGLKEQFYQGRTLDPVECVRHGLEADRVMVRHILPCVSARWREPEYHVDIHGPRYQGKTMVLAKLAFVLAGRGIFRDVLWLDAAVLEQQRRHEALSATAVNHMKTYRGARKRLFVVIDNFAVSTSSPPSSDELHRLTIFCGWMRSNGFVLITSTPEVLPLGTRSTYHLREMAPSEAREIIRAMNRRPSILKKGFAEDPDALLAVAGGTRYYKNELPAFMSLVVDSALSGERITQRLNDSLQDLAPSDDNALKFVSVCQLVEMPLSEAFLVRLLQKSAPGCAADLQRLPERTGRLVRGERTACGAMEFSLGAPHFAGWLLRERFNIQDPGQLEELYSDILGTVAPEEWQHLSIVQADFLRHILQKLAKQRDFRFRPRGAVRASQSDFVRGLPIALALFQRFRVGILSYLDNSKDVEALCVWAETIARMHDLRLAWSLCKRAVGELASGANASGRAFVALADALDELHANDRRTHAFVRQGVTELARRYATLLADRARQEDADLFDYHNRLNQVVHSIMKLCNRIGSHDEAKRAFEQFDESCQLTEPASTHMPRADAVTLLEYATALDKKGDAARAGDVYAVALRVARQRRLSHPSHYPMALTMWARFLSRESGKAEGMKGPTFLAPRRRPRWWPSRPAAEASQTVREMFRMAAELRDQAPEGYPRCLCAHAEWLLAKARTAVTKQEADGCRREAQSLYEESQRWCGEDSVDPYTSLHLADTLAVHGDLLHQSPPTDAKRRALALYDGILRDPHTSRGYRWRVRSSLGVKAEKEEIDGGDIRLVLDHSLEDAEARLAESPRSSLVPLWLASLVVGTRRDILGQKERTKRILDSLFGAWQNCQDQRLALEEILELADATAHQMARAAQRTPDPVNYRDAFLIARLRECIDRLVAQAGKSLKHRVVLEQVLLVSSDLEIAGEITKELLRELRIAE